ncbi:MAG: flavodoxin domain-containing protein [Firmicutes bacterium]|nr:flavodoxin domain-containing protein [Bacillota bacterium]
MRTLLLYASKHGCVEKCAQLMVERIPHQVKTINLAKEKVLDLAEYDTVIIGGSIHVGKIQKEVSQFCVENEKELHKNRVGLYLCCANDEQVEAQMKEAYPSSLLQHAVAVEHLGYAYYFDRMNFIEKTIIRKIAKTSTTTEKIALANLERFITKLYAKELS